MSSPSNLPYAPYQSHRRAASTASNSAALATLASGPGANSGGSTQPAQSDRQLQPSAFVRQRVSQSPQGDLTRSAVTPPASSGSSAGRGGNVSSAPAPPPLRSAASLRAASESAEQGLANGHFAQQHSNNGKGKGKENAVATAPIESNVAIPSRSAPPSASTTTSPTRRSVSSALTVPSSASAVSAEVTRSNGHNKRLSLSPTSATAAGSAVGHARSSSYSTNRTANLPHLMSTAQRLRTVSPLGHAASTSPNASSPSHTPTASPALNTTFGAPPLTQHLSTLPGPHGDDGVGRRTAYRPGFQPKGMYRVRTDEFIAARTRRKQGGGENSGGNRSIDPSSSSEPTPTKSRSELESQRLERRLEKLLLLHYDDVPLFSEEEAFGVAPAWLPGTIRKARLQTEMERRLRDEEMRIVKWEDDKSRKACSVCSTPFSFTVRKHHCRLCGRVVCASPHLSMLLPGGAAAGKDGGDVEDQQTAATTADEVKCSGLVVVDGGKGSTKIKDVPRWDEAARQGLDADGRTRGIRICRTCKETILHRQYMLDDGTVPAYVKLYEALRALQREIEQSLPEFQEMVLGLQKHDAAAALGTSTEDAPHDPLVAQPSSHSAAMAALKAKNRTTLALQRDAAQARKQLLANFANYDLLAKKIRALDDNGNASLARLKMAIWTQANVFLQSNMFPLQNLPKLAGGKSSSSSRQSTPPPPPAHHDDAQHESIAVLEQQLGLVRQYAASASKARKFQDASCLTASARDLEAEIARLRAAASSSSSLSAS